MSKKILIIEDEEIILDILQKKLLKEGYDVLAARNGEEGIKIMREQNPHLVLLDIVMPKMNGFEVLKTASEDPKLKQIPIIIISNSGQPVELDMAKRLGAKDCLVKIEFDPQEVLEKVVNQIGR